MTVKRVFNHTLLLAITNLMFSACGIGLVFSGFYLFMDESRVLLSRLVCAGSEQLADLPQPLFYYIALGLVGAGMVAIIASLIGWWATCLNTYCTFSMYFMLVLLLLLVEFAICLLITLWPQCLGLNLDEAVMERALQGSYGVPGREQLTIAMDLAQTQFNCCGINGNVNYDTSLWRLQGYGQRDWTVPLTCCQLIDQGMAGSHLDPKPVNFTMCQSLERHEYDQARHKDGCLNKIDVWYREQYVMFLAATLLLAVVEFCVLLSIILSCTRLQQHRDRTAIVDRVTFEPKMASMTRRNSGTVAADNIYTDNVQNTNTLPTEEIKEVYVQPSELYRSKNSAPFKSSQSKYQYQISKSYLV